MTDLRSHTPLGLVLGGGGALGAAHIGIIQVLHERGIDPQVVAGSSSGALVAAAFAAGLDPYELERSAAASSWRSFGWLALASKTKLLESLKLPVELKRVVPDGSMTSLPKKLGLGATKVWGCKEVTLTDCGLLPAIKASVAVPLLYTPVWLDGRLLVDGGALTQLPLRITFDLGATHVIGVRVAKEWDRLPWVPRRPDVHELEKSDGVTMIYPNLRGHSQWTSREIPTLIRLGREAAEAALTDYPVVNPQR